MIKVKAVSLIQSIRPPKGGNALDALSFDSSIYELWDCGDRVYIAHGENVIGVPITAVKRIEYLKLEDTPLASKPLQDETELNLDDVKPEHLLPGGGPVPVKRGPGRPPKHANG